MPVHQFAVAPDSADELSFAENECTVTGVSEFSVTEVAAESTMTIKDELSGRGGGVVALRRAAALIRQNPNLADAARAPLMERDFERLAHRLEEPNAQEWDLGKECAFLAPHDIGAVVMASELTRSHPVAHERLVLRENLFALEAFLRRYLTCWD
jgi:hypothetical protein